MYPSNTTNATAVRRIKCPVHGGKNRSVAIGYINGRAWAKCHSRECASKDILAALNLSNTPSIRWTPPPMPPRPVTTVAPLPPVSPIAASLYLSGITTPDGATIQYQRYDGQTGKHWRNEGKRRNPGVKGDGWMVRRFNPPDPGAAPAIALAEGEKDAAVLALSGLIAFCAPRGAQSLPAADLGELVELAKETGLPVILAGDNDDVGHKAMLRIRENLRKAGLNPLDTISHAPHKGSIADLPARELAALVDRLIEPHNSRWQKPARNHRRYAQFRCLRPKRWQGLAGDTSSVKDLRSCSNTAVCGRCEAWAVYLHIERAVRGNPAQLVTVAGFGAADSTIPETVGMAKIYRTRQEARMSTKRKNRRVCQKGIPTENPSDKLCGFMSALRIGDDYRASLTFLFQQPLTDAELAKERTRAERAGLTFRVIDNPGRQDIEAIAPRSLTESMQRELTIEERAELTAEEKGGIAYNVKKTVGDTKVTHTWTSSGWPDWEENPAGYAFSDGRELRDNEAFDPDSITTAEWKKDNHQGWDGTLTLRANLERIEVYAHHNSQLWMSPCLGLNIETLRAVGDATGKRQIKALIAEIGDYDGPTALLRDTAAYLKTGKGWRSAYGPVLDAAGYRE